MLRRGNYQLYWEQGRNVKKRTLPIDRIDPYNILQVAITRRELPILRGGGHVIRAPNKIVHVLAIVGGGDGIVTSFEAELVAAHESVFGGQESAGAHASRIDDMKTHIFPNWSEYVRPRSVSMDGDDSRIPVIHLRKRLPIRIRRSIRKDDPTKRVALKISAMRVKLPASVGRVQAQPSVIDEPDYLNICGCLGPLGECVL